MGLVYINRHQKSRVEHKITQKGQDHRRGGILWATSSAPPSTQESLGSFSQHKQPQAFHRERQRISRSPSLRGHLGARSGSGAAELDGTNVREGEEDSPRARSGRACDPWVRGLEAPGEHGVASVALMARRVRVG